MTLPKTCTLDHYVHNIFEYAKKIDIETENKLFRTEKTRKRPALNFNKYKLKGNFSITPEEFTNKYPTQEMPKELEELLKQAPELKQLIQTRQDIICKQQDYIITKDNDEMIAGAELFTYELNNQKIIQIGDSITSRIYIAVSEQLRNKGIGNDLLHAIIKDACKEKAKIYIIEPTQAMIKLLHKHEFKNENNTYMLDY